MADKTSATPIRTPVSIADIHGRADGFIHDVPVRRGIRWIRGETCNAATELGPFLGVARLLSVVSASMLKRITDGSTGF